MKKLKSIVKRLLGRPTSSAPLTIDICAETSEGYVVIGWYLTDVISELSLLDDDKQSIDIETTDIDRADVIAHLGMPAQGFQITCTTSKSIADIQLCAKLKNGGSQSFSLSLDGSASIAASGADPEKIAKIASSKDDVKMSCEFMIASSTHFFVSGWLVDKTSKVDAEIRTKKGDEIAELEVQLRNNRKDVRDVMGPHIKTSTGFLILFKRLDSKTYSSKDLKFCVELDGKRHTVDIQDIFHADSDAMVNAKRLLNGWTPTDPAHLKAHAMFNPILNELYPKDKTAQARRVDINGKVESPAVSIIIPIYGRYDFIQFQMSHFSRYEAYRDAEIIYVIDDPKIASQAKALSLRVGQVCQQPFSLLILSENVGFGLANNIGVKHAGAETLVLLNSDVLPKGADWLEQMHSVAKGENVGIVGARLLFEDDTIQHDGMAPMVLREYPGLLFNDHPKKGWPQKMAAYDSEVEQIDLLTAACWMINKSLFEHVGGFDPSYILGDFEDSDLCFKVLELGKQNFIHHGTQLYHLERQSQNLVEAGNWKHNLTILNAVTFNQRWQNQLEALAGTNSK